MSELSDPDRLPYADAHFDMAVTTCALHHVLPSQWPKFAAEVKRRVVSNCELDAGAVLPRSAKSRALLAGVGFGPLTRKLDLVLGSLSLGAQFFVLGAS